MEQGLGWLFESQCISYSMQGRGVAHDLIIAAITRAIHHCQDTHKTPRINDGAEIHKAPTMKAGDQEHEEDLVLLFHNAMVLQYGSATKAWGAFGEDGVLGKKGSRKMIKKLLPSLQKSKAKLLRKKLPKNLDLVGFCRFMGESDHLGDGPSTVVAVDSTRLARLPTEVPKLPPAFRARPHAHEQLVSALMDSSSHSTSVTAPKSRVSSQGMVRRTHETKMVKCFSPVKSRLIVSSCYHLRAAWARPC